MIDEKISYESRKEKLPTKKMAKTSKEELMYYLSPFYSEDAIKDLTEDQLDDLLDEVILSKTLLSMFIILVDL